MSRFELTQQPVRERERVTHTYIRICSCVCFFLFWFVGTFPFHHERLFNASRGGAARSLFVPSSVSSPVMFFDHPNPCRTSRRWPHKMF